MVKVESTALKDLTAEEKMFFVLTHNGEDKSGLSKEVLGWYVRENLRISFYYVPSWLTRKKMYWLHGWTWIPADL